MQVNMAPQLMSEQTEHLYGFQSVGVARSQNVHFTCAWNMLL